MFFFFFQHYVKKINESKKSVFLFLAWDYTVCTLQKVENMECCREMFLKAGQWDSCLLLDLLRRKDLWQTFMMHTLFVMYDDETLTGAFQCILPFLVDNVGHLAAKSSAVILEPIFKCRISTNSITT